jgi:hypothetical protein
MQLHVFAHKARKFLRLFLLYFLIKRFNHQINFIFLFLKILRTKLDYTCCIIFEKIFMHSYFIYVLMQITKHTSCIYLEYTNTNNQTKNYVWIEPVPKMSGSSGTSHATTVQQLNRRYEELAQPQLQLLLDQLFHSFY